MTEILCRDESRAVDPYTLQGKSEVTSSSPETSGSTPTQTLAKLQFMCSSNNLVRHCFDQSEVQSGLIVEWKRWS